MRIITGSLSNKAKIRAALCLFAVLISVLSLGSVAYRKGAAKNEGEGEDYIYKVYTESSGEHSAAIAEDEGKGVLVLGKDYDSNRTDAIICVYFNYKENSVATLQIPRDTYVTDGDYKGRINSLLPRYRAMAANSGAENALEAGIHRLMQKIEADFCIPLDNYIFIDSAAIEKLTDAVGGVKLDIPANIDYTDKSRGIDLHLKEGTQLLNGKQASQFVRYRQGYPQADIGRINAQKLYAAAMLDRLTSFSTLASAINVTDALSAYIKTDIDAESMALLTTKLFLAKQEDVVMYTMPGDGVKVGSGSYYGVFAPQLAEVLSKGFAPTKKESIKAEDFSHLGGGYTDTDGVKLSSVLKHGLSIPVYAS